MWRKQQSVAAGGQGQCLDLGPEYNDALTEAYAAVTQKDIFEERSFITGIMGDALADTLPMSKLIERYVTPPFLDAIATEYAKGRLLFMGTTNLDARRPIIWNMTAMMTSSWTANPIKRCVSTAGRWPRSSCILRSST